MIVDVMCAHCGEVLGEVDTQELTWPIDYDLIKNTGGRVLDPINKDEPICHFCENPFQPVPNDGKVSLYPFYPLLTNKGVLRPPPDQDLRWCECGCGRQIPPYAIKTRKFYDREYCWPRYQKQRKEEKAKEAVNV